MTPCPPPPSDYAPDLGYIHFWVMISVTCGLTIQFTRVMATELYLYVVCTCFHV